MRRNVGVTGAGMRVRHHARRLTQGLPGTDAALRALDNRQRGAVVMRPKPDLHAPLSRAAA